MATLRIEGVAVWRVEAIGDNLKALEQDNDIVLSTEPCSKFVKA